MQTNMNARSKEEIFVTAYNYEDKGAMIYSNLNGGELFDGIGAIRKNGIALLEQMAAIKGYNLTKWSHQIIVPEDGAEKLIVALNYELELNEFYKNATDNADEDVRDLYFRLWATSNNEYIPALKANLFGSVNAQRVDANPNLDDKEREHDNPNLNSGNPNNSNFGDINGFLEQAQKIANNEIDPKTIGELVKSPYFSFFSGVAAGGLLAASAGDLIKKFAKE